MNKSEFSNEIHYLIGLKKNEDESTTLPEVWEWNRRLEYEIDLLADKLGVKDD